MKIYIENSLNGICGKNYYLYLYMTEEQVLKNTQFIQEDLEGNDFINTSDLPREDYFDRLQFLEISKNYKVDMQFLFETLDWQEPETLANELEPDDLDEVNFEEPKEKDIVNYLKNIKSDLSNLEYRLGLDYNLLEDFEQHEEDRLIIGNIVDLINNLK